MKPVDIEAARAEGALVGYAPGIYDLFHIGHLNLLRNAKAHCDFLTAGVVSDDLCEQRKGKRPIVPLAERLEIVSSLRCVDRAIAEDGPTKIELWEEHQFHLIFKGSDWQGSPGAAEMQADFDPYGVKLFFLPYTLTTSSTLLRRALEVLTA